MNRVHIGLGSNVQPLQQLAKAIAKLRLRFAELSVSPAYRNPADGFDGDDFVNAVVSLVTAEPLSEVLRVLKQIELDLGKDLSLPRFAAKLIDVDLLYFGDLVLRHDRLDLPRSDLSACPYYLQGLAQIAPDWIDPESGRSMQQMWAAFTGDAGLEPVALADVAPYEDAILSMSELQLAVHLGVPEDERAVRQDVQLSMRIEFEVLPVACVQDSLEGTVDYGVVSQRLHDLVARVDFKTLEHLASQCLQIACEQASASSIGRATIVVTVRKYPKIAGLLGGAAVELTARLP